MPRRPGEPRIPRRHLNPKGRPKPHNAYVELEIKTPFIYPGQEALAQWSIYFPPSPDFDLGSTVVADIFLNDTLVYSSPQFPYKPDDKLIQVVKLVIPDELYRVGKKIAILEVTGDGVDPGPFIDDGELEVVRVPVQPGWWEWSCKVDTLNNADWKQDLQLKGKFINKSGTTMKKADILLYEEDREALGSFRSRGSISIHVLDPGVTKEVSFPGVIHEWEWLTPVTFITKGPFSKIFNYHTSFSLEDIYGNAYPDVESRVASFEVKVPDKKIAFGITATSAAGSAAVCFATGTALAAFVFTAAAGAALLAEAAFLYAAAGTSAMKANCLL
jgi:hypothetical protein